VSAESSSAELCAAGGSLAPRRGRLQALAQAQHRLQQEPRAVPVAHSWGTGIAWLGRERGKNEGEGRPCLAPALERCSRAASVTVTSQHTAREAEPY